MTLIIHASDISFLEKWGHKISFKELQIILHPYYLLANVVIYKCGTREEILKGPFVKQVILPDVNEIAKIFEKYKE